MQREPKKRLNFFRHKHKEKKSILIFRAFENKKIKKYNRDRGIIHITVIQASTYYYQRFYSLNYN